MTTILLDEPIIADYEEYVILALVLIYLYTQVFAPKKKRSFTIKPAVKKTNKQSKKIPDGYKPILLVYGSQTGTAESYARRLAKEAKRYKMWPRVVDAEDLDRPELLTERKEDFVIFLVSTYGEGEPTDSTRDLHQWMGEEENPDEMAKWGYSVFGLGNKTYEYYNSMGKFFDAKMEKLGATRVYPMGLGDDNGSLEDDFAEWKEDLWTKVCEHYGMDPSSHGETYECALKLKMESSLATPARRFKSSTLVDPKHPYAAPIIVNRELHTEQSDRSCRHIELDISGSSITYEAGDHLGVYAQNNPAVVQEIAELLNVELDAMFSLEIIDEDGKVPFPTPCTFRTAFTHYIDLTGPLRKNVFAVLAHFAKDEQEKNQLLLMSSPSPEGKAQYHKYILDDQRTIAQVLQDHPSVTVPPADFIEIMPALQPRFFSISSSSKVTPKTISITAVVVKNPTPTGRLLEGVCTTYLENLVPVEGEEPPKVLMYVRRSNFHLPRSAKPPMIFIGPGTGLAPLRGFLHDLRFRRERGAKMGRKVGEVDLYFGCRHPDHDYLYQEELEAFKDDETLTELNVCFSRSPDHEKEYVQERLYKNKERVFNLLGAQKGFLYVCGDAAHMANDVHTTILKIAQEVGDMNESQAVDWIHDIERKNRYAKDVW